MSALATAHSQANRYKECPKEALMALDRILDPWHAAGCWRGVEDLAGVNSRVARRLAGSYYVKSRLNRNSR